MNAIDLLLEDYIALLRVGVNPHERTAPQRVQITVSARLKKMPAADRLEETYNYEQIITAIHALSQTHFDLLESFAAALAKQLLADKKLTRVKITLMKLDIIQGGRIGVRYRLGK